MKITREWLEEEIAKCDKNIEYYNNHYRFGLITREYGIKEGLEKVLHRKNISNRSCVIFNKSVPMWKRRIIRFLKHFCDWLEGVENVNISKRDLIEKRNDEAINIYKRYEKYN